MHMRFLSRGFKNLQWYGMTKKSSKLKGLLDFPFLSGSLNFPIFALERR